MAIKITDTVRASTYISPVGGPADPVVFVGGVAFLPDPPAGWPGPVDPENPDGPQHQYDRGGELRYYERRDEYTVETGATEDAGYAATVAAILADTRHERKASASLTQRWV